MNFVDVKRCGKCDSLDYTHHHGFPVCTYHKTCAYQKDNVEQEEKTDKELPSLQQLLLNDLHRTGVIDDDIFRKASKKITQLNAPHPIPLERMKHSIGVAEYMYRHAMKYNLEPEKMYVIGLLHDIGYISGEKVGHERYGADLVERCFSTCYGMSYSCGIIAEHGTTPQEYLKEHSLVSAELHLLWEADMSVDLSGENVGFEKRLEDIGKRHGVDSQAYNNCKQTIEWLKENEV